MYGSLAIVGFVAGCLFYICFRKSDSLDPVAQRLFEGVPVGTYAAADTSESVENGKSSE
jgi:POT family proton-dependent oligopeptide transporter